MSTIFKGARGDISSKRVIGAVCIAFSIGLCSWAFYASGSKDIPVSVQSVALQFLLTGAGMITAGLLEKKEEKSS